MAQNEYMIGGATAVATSVNTAGAWDGAAGADIWLRPIAEQAELIIGYDLLSDQEIGRTPRQAPFGGAKCAGSITRFMSYAYLENILRLILQGAITTTPGSPNLHEIAYAENSQIFGGHKFYWADFVGGEYEIDVLNMTITKLTIDLPTNSTTPTIAETFEAQSWEVIPGGSIITPTISSYDLVRWSDISIFLAGTEYCMGKIVLDLDSPIKADSYGHCSSAGSNRVSLIRNSVMTVGLNCDKEMDSVDLGWLTANKTGIGDYTTNYILINNGGVGAAEREIKFPLGTAYLKPPGVQTATQGPIPFTAAFDIRDTGATGYIRAHTKNALASIT